MQINTSDVWRGGEAWCCGVHCLPSIKCFWQEETGRLESLTPGHMLLASGGLTQGAILLWGSWHFQQEEPKIIKKNHVSPFIYHSSVPSQPRHHYPRNCHHRRCHQHFHLPRHCHHWHRVGSPSYSALATRWHMLVARHMSQDQETLLTSSSAWHIWVLSSVSQSIHRKLDQYEDIFLSLKELINTYNTKSIIVY